MRYRTDGCLEFLGRIDDQVKIRGYRVELGEVEAELARCPGVDRAAVALQTDDQGNRRLLGVVTSVGGAPLDTRAVRSWLEQARPRVHGACGDRDGRAASTHDERQGGSHLAVDVGGPPRCRPRLRPAENSV